MRFTTNYARLLLAVIWTLAYGTWRFATYAAAWQNDGRPRWRLRRRDAFSWGRGESPKAMRCADCNWAGPLRWAVHTYRADGMGDVEPVDLCPECRGEDTLDPVLGSRKGWSS